MIPKVIHYCWFGGKPLPKEVEKYIKSWRLFCPDYKIIQWNESNFDINCHDFVRDAYYAKSWAFVSDYARLKIIYENGGIYLDTDVELLKNLDFLLDNRCYFGIQQGEHLCNTGIGFGAEEGNPVILKMLSLYDEIKFDIERKNGISCPRLNNSVIKAMGYEYTDQPKVILNTLILPCRFFDPYSTGNSKNLLCEDTVSIHHYTASWLPVSIRIKRKIANLLGIKNIQKLKHIYKRN